MLVCVLVVLLVTGMLLMLGLRLMLASNNSQHERAKILQAQELVGLGRMVLMRSAAENSTAMPSQLPALELMLSARWGGQLQPALVTMESMAESEKTEWRIIARYPYNQPGEVQATWRGEPGN